MATTSRACEVLRFVAADRFVLARLDHAEQLGLLFGRQDVDFVEQQRAAAGGGELAFAVAVGPGERAFDVAEQFALDQIRRQSAAGDGAEAVFAAVGKFVNQAGEKRLAAARFADRAARSRCAGPRP